MKLNEDGTLSLPSATMSAQEVDQLLHDLAHLRCQMSPEIPRSMKQAADNVVWQVDPDFAISMTAVPNVTVAIRNAGFGWQVFAFPPDKAAALGQRLIMAAGHVHTVMLDDSMASADVSH